MNQVTLYIMVFTVVAIILYDIFAYFKEGVNATISSELNALAKKYPIIAFAFGVLIGHWFWGIC